jgi:hypothetical protein
MPVLFRTLSASFNHGHEGLSLPKRKVRDFDDVDCNGLYYGI